MILNNGETLTETNHFDSALCNSYLQLTSRGVSILFATGDGGVASTPGVSCSGKGKFSRVLISIRVCSLNGPV